MLSIKCLGTFLGLEEIEANENETPFPPHFHACMPNFATKMELVGVQISGEWSHCKSFQNSSELNHCIYLYNITQSRNYDQFVLIHHIHLPSNTDLGWPKVLLEENMGDQKMLHLFSLSSYA